MALTPVPDGHLATVVTTLEMRERPRPRPSTPSPFALRHWPNPAIDRYRMLFRRVGEPWLWYSRLAMADDALAALLRDPGIEVYAVTDRAGIEIGMIELDFRNPGDCALVYFALVPELAGKGHGRWMMGQALHLGWRSGVTRMWTNTCTLDHHHALGFYCASGFVPVRRTIETFPDPRLTRLLAPDAAPQVPRLADPSSR